VGGGGGAKGVDLRSSDRRAQRAVAERAMAVAPPELIWVLLCVSAGREGVSPSDTFRIANDIEGKTPPPPARAGGTGWRRWWCCVWQWSV
jgi:hypothetical protein